MSRSYEDFLSKRPRRLTINTVYRSKPYPQWSAIADEHPDIVGYGDTEAEAVRDLYDVIADRELDEEDQNDQDRFEYETEFQRGIK